MSDSAESSTQDDAGHGRATVHVVLANYADDPHPHVEAVYDNEEAAEDHEKALGDSTSICAPVSWTVKEMPVQSEIDGCPVCGEDYSEGYLKNEDSDLLRTTQRCPGCRSEVPV